MKQILSKKIGMTQYMKPDGKMVPVTVLQVGKCQVVQVKTIDRDGYCAIQVGIDDVADSKLGKAASGQFKKTITKYRHLLEFKYSDGDNVTLGGYLNVDMFQSGDLVNVTSISIGKGFQGTIKRWNFHRGLMTHGSKSHRIPGSIGGHTYPGRVFKGKKMAGRMGNDKVTVKNLEIVEIDETQGVLLVKGAVPGCRGAIVKLEAKGEFKTTDSYVDRNKNEQKPAEIVVEVEELKETPFVSEIDQSPVAETEVVEQAIETPEVVTSIEEEVMASDSNEQSEDIKNEN